MEKEKMVSTISIVGNVLGLGGGLLLAKKYKPTTLGYIGGAFIGSLIVGVAFGATTNLFVKEKGIVSPNNASVDDETNDMQEGSSSMSGASCCSGTTTK